MEWVCGQTLDQGVVREVAQCGVRAERLRSIRQPGEQAKKNAILDCRASTPGKREGVSHVALRRVSHGCFSEREGELCHRILMS